MLGNNGMDSNPQISNRGRYDISNNKVVKKVVQIISFLSFNLADLNWPKEQSSFIRYLCSNLMCSPKECPATEADNPTIISDVFLPCFGLLLTNKAKLGVVRMGWVLKRDQVLTRTA